jgi:hypothetical protein
MAYYVRAHFLPSPQRIKSEARNRIVVSHSWLKDPKYIPSPMSARYLTRKGFKLGRKFSPYGWKDERHWTLQERRNEKIAALEMIRLTPLFMRTILTVGGSNISKLTVNLLDLVCSTHMGTGDGDDD